MNKTEILDLTIPEHKMNYLRLRIQYYKSVLNRTLEMELALYKATLELKELEGKSNG